MNQANPQNIPTKADETPSNNENNMKQTAIIPEDTRNLLDPKAGKRKRTQCNETSTASFQHTRRIIEVHQQQIPDSYATVDIKK